MYKFGEDVYDKWLEQWTTFEGYVNKEETVAILTTGMHNEETYLRRIEHVSIRKDQQDFMLLWQT